MTIGGKDLGRCSEEMLLREWADNYLFLQKKCFFFIFPIKSSLLLTHVMLNIHFVVYLEEEIIKEILDWVEMDRHTLRIKEKRR